jgi:putrescine transport system substrate-binding protein
VIRVTDLPIAALCSSLVLLIGCGRTDTGEESVSRGDDKILNLYDWADDVAPDTISSFEKLTGIKVHVSYFDSNETLRTRMLTGNSGFDVVVPSVTFLKREILSGAYLSLDKTKLSNLTNLDPAIMAQLAPSDPGNAHAVAYEWGTVGIGYNEKLVKEALPNAPLDSWGLMFDPVYAAKLAKCGINMFDDPIGVIGLALIYLGKSPNAPTAQDLSDVEKVLAKIRPYVRNFETSGAIEAIANGDICISIGYNGDMLQARRRAEEAKNGVIIRYVIPKEGSTLWITLWAIPRDTLHAANAHLFINYMMTPQVVGNITNSVGFANAVPDSSPYLDSSITADSIVYPTPDERKRLVVPMEGDPEQNRTVTRMWQKFKTGQ